MFPLLAILLAAALVCYIPLAPLILYLNAREKRYVAAMAAQRKGEDIGTFARSFDRRSRNFDPWVIRATWDALMDYMDYPIRASDRIDDLGIDPDDISFCVIPEIVERSGHVLAGEQSDIRPGRETVGDLVLFVSSLKRIDDTPPASDDGQAESH